MSTLVSLIQRGNLEALQEASSNEKLEPKLLLTIIAECQREIFLWFFETQIDEQQYQDLDRDIHYLYWPKEGWNGLSCNSKLFEFWKGIIEYGQINSYHRTLRNVQIQRQYQMITSGDLEALGQIPLKDLDQDLTLYVVQAPVEKRIVIFNWLVERQWLEGEPSYRFNFGSEVTRSVIKSGDLELLKAVATVRKDRLKWRPICPPSWDKGVDPDYSTKLHKYQKWREAPYCTGPICSLNDCGLDAIKFGQLEMLKWLLKEFGGTPYLQRIGCYNHKPMPNMPGKKEYFVEAVEANQPKIWSWLRQHYGLDPKDPVDLDLLEVCFRTVVRGRPLERNAVEQAAILEWLYQDCFKSQVLTDEMIRAGLVYGGQALEHPSTLGKEDVKRRMEWLKGHSPIPISV